jgi:hypothetical protein
LRVKTEPSVHHIEERLSRRDWDKDHYFGAINDLKEEGYGVRSILLKRRYCKPGFSMGAPLKILADYDPQLDDADVVLLLRKER